MKKSIRYKLFAGIGLITFCFVFLSWILNSQLLEKYYLFEKKQTLKGYGEKIDSIFTGSSEAIDLELEKIENTNGINILILNDELKIKYSSSARIFDQRPPEARPPIIPDASRMNPKMNPKHNMGMTFPANKNGLIEELNNQKQKYVFKIQNVPRSKTDFLFLVSALHTKDILILRVPLASLTENARIANDFMFLSGILIFIMGIIFAYLFSIKFTKPILELNRIAQNMANLDFTKKCAIETEDEIGELGKRLNYLSEQLKNAMTELHQKNEKLTIEIEKEKQIDEMRKEFISSVSHELRTPISLIQGYAEGLKYNIASDEKNKNDYCEVIIDETNKMNKLVKDLLNLSQIESGFFELEKSDFDIGELIEQVLGKYQNIFKKKEIQLQVEKNVHTLVNGDIVRIEQVLVNYLNNALNHVNADKSIKIKLDEIKDKVRVTVFNSGKPIPAEFIDKIWISFYKVDKARTREYCGYGLGLSVVKAIQEQHNCDFGMQNMENGVQFWFEISKHEKLK
jgi:two-component system sensor histidine kinase VanS